MPRRTNDFQQLVKLIEAQLAFSRATVRESILMQDAEGDQREIDVLIETRIGQHDVTIAVECRDHKRRADKTWIEQLMGKYDGLPIHKVIAVSRSGFSAPAIEKARRQNIVTLTLEEARDENWLNAIYGHETAYVTTVRFLPIHIDLAAATVPEESGDAEFNVVYNSNGAPVGRVPDYFFHLLHARFEATKVLMEPLILAYDSKTQSFSGGASVATLNVPVSSVLFLDSKQQLPITGWRYSFTAQVARSSVSMGLLQWSAGCNRTGNRARRATANGTGE